MTGAWLRSLWRSTRAWVLAMTNLTELRVQLAEAEMASLDAMGKVVADLKSEGATRHEARILICVYSGAHSERALMLFDMIWGEGS